MTKAFSHSHNEEIARVQLCPSGRDESVYRGTGGHRFLGAGLRYGQRTGRCSIADRILEVAAFGKGYRQRPGEGVSGSHRVHDLDFESLHVTARFRGREIGSLLAELDDRRRRCWIWERLRGFRRRSDIVYLHAGEDRGLALVRSNDVKGRVPVGWHGRRRRGVPNNRDATPPSRSGSFQRDIRRNFEQAMLAP